MLKTGSNGIIEPVLLCTKVFREAQHSAWRAAGSTELLLVRDGTRHPPTLPTKVKHFSYSLAKTFIMPKGFESVNLGSDQDFAVENKNGFVFSLEQQNQRNCIRPQLRALKRQCWCKKLFAWLSHIPVMAGICALELFPWQP